MKGHLDQEQKNIFSTQSHQDFLDNIHPKQEHLSHNIPAAIINVNSKTAKSYSDQTGRFPIFSSCGNQYIFILYNYDTNSIHAQLLKKRQALEITSAWMTFHEHLKQQGADPTLHILDNEFSHTMHKSSASTTLTSILFPVHLPPQRLRTCNPHIQKSSLRQTRLFRPQLSLPGMRSSHFPGHNHSRPPPIFPHKPKPFRPRSHQLKL